MPPLSMNSQEPARRQVSAHCAAAAKRQTLGAGLRDCVAIISASLIGDPQPGPAAQDRGSSALLEEPWITGVCWPA